MIKLIGTAAAALALTAAFVEADAARANRAPAAAPHLTVVLGPEARLAAPRTIVSGRRTLTFRNRSSAPHTFRIVRVPGGMASLLRFEGLLFLPSSSRIVRNLGEVAAGRWARTTLSLTRGDYVLAALDGIAVVAARELRVT
jgi:hypothetical protein